MANRVTAAFVLVSASCALFALAAPAEDVHVMLSDVLEAGASIVEREAAFVEGWLRRHLAQTDVVGSARRCCSPAGPRTRPAAAWISVLRCLARLAADGDGNTPSS
jgi:hypothetical protein